MLRWVKTLETRPQERLKVVITLQQFQSATTWMPEPDLLDDFALTQGLANPGSIQPQIRPGVYLEVGTSR